jgi:hypothetical protein
MWLGRGTIVWSDVKLRLEFDNFRAVSCGPKRHAIPHSQTHSHTHTHTYTHSPTLTHYWTHTNTHTQNLVLLFTRFVYKQDTSSVEYYSVHNWWSADRYRSVIYDRI